MPVAEPAALLKKINAARKKGDLLESSAEHLTAWLEAEFLPDWALESLDELVGGGEWEALNDRFYKQLSFGTGGIRGKTMMPKPTKAEQGTPSPVGAPEHPGVGTAMLNDFVLARAAVGFFRYAEAYIAQDPLRFEVPKIVISHDVRHYSRHFAELVASIWTHLGGIALLFDGPRSTPQLSFAVRHLKCTCGAMITASHNPPEDNGFKAYFEDGGQTVSPHAEGIVEQANAVELASLPPYLEIDLEGVRILGPEVDEAYLEVLEETVLDQEVLEDQAPKVVFTPIHGTGAVSSVPALKRFGVEAILPEAQAEPDGRFPTVKSPNPENADALQQAIELAKEEDADVVLATDPDADRMGVAVPGASDEDDWVLLTGNVIGSLLAEYRITTLKEMEILPEGGDENAALIKTFVTTPLQRAIGEEHGLKVIDTLTGFKWIGEKLHLYEEAMASGLVEEEGLVIDYDATDISTRVQILRDYSTYYVFGGEESYGYLASDRVRDKDANSAVLMFCEMVAHLKRTGVSVLEYLDGLYQRYGYYTEGLLNLYFEGAEGSAKIQRIIQSYRDDAPESMAGFDVEKVTDFGAEDLEDADGKPVPKENFFVLELAGGYSFAVRGSGTEPKIKFYTFAHEPVEEPGELSGAKAKAEETLRKLAEALEADARERAEGEG
ncbi:MAG: phospho-sugar mutase [Opitutales bacterium]